MTTQRIFYEGKLHTETDTWVTSHNFPEGAYMYSTDSRRWYIITEGGIAGITTTEVPTAIRTTNLLLEGT